VVNRDKRGQPLALYTVPDVMDTQGQERQQLVLTMGMKDVRRLSKFIENDQVRYLLLTVQLCMCMSLVRCDRSHVCPMTHISSQQMSVAP
jgi:hypothetical protein